MWWRSSLPGFGFSDKPDGSGYCPERMALILAELMANLGHERYALANRDWGQSSIAIAQR